MAAILEAAGVATIEVPAIEIHPPADGAAFDAALRGLAGYEWIVFTSAHAVDALRDRLDALSLVLPETVRLASVGPATTQAVARAWPSRRVEVEPASEYRAESLVAAFGGLNLDGRRVLLPVSSRALAVVEEGLVAEGAIVDRVEAYQTVAVPFDVLRSAIGTGVHAVAVASPSAVEGLAGARHLLRDVPVVAIGPTTADAVGRAGLRLGAVAEAATADAVARALLEVLGRP